MTPPIAKLYFPTADHWETTTPSRAGLQAGSVDAALEYAKRAASSQVIILHQGRLLAEQYVGADAKTVADVFAIQKAVFSWLFGIAQSRGLIHLDDALSKHLGEGWTQLPAAAERKILVRHLMTMTTGLDDTLTASGETGVTWHYNNIAYNYLKYALCDLAGLDLNELTRRWLGEPLGWTHTRWVDRENLLPDGRPLTALLMNARDIARFGLAMLAGGYFGQSAVLDDVSYLRDCLKPGSAANPAWGYMWWINGQSHYMQAFSSRVNQGSWAPGAPADLYGARGANELRLLILPSHSLVIARIGERVARELGNFDSEFLRRLLEGAQAAQ